MPVGGVGILEVILFSRLYVLHPAHAPTLAAVGRDTVELGCGFLFGFVLLSCISGAFCTLPLPQLGERGGGGRLSSGVGTVFFLTCGLGVSGRLWRVCSGWRRNV